MSSPILDAFIAEAQDVSLAEAAGHLGLKLSGRGVEHVFPCPVTGGKDRFSINTSKNAWNCRGCGTGGRDAIGLAAHQRSLDVKRRSEFLAACAAVLGKEVPDEGEQLTPERRAEIEADTAKRKELAQVASARKEREQNEFRDRERSRARGIYQNGSLPVSGDAVWQYLMARTGISNDRLGSLGWVHIVDRLTFWHGQDEIGNPRDVWCGPAMIFPFIDGSGEIIGCHQTWVDMANSPKYRPAISDPDKPGETLQTKKMRGSKTGGLIPVGGDPSATRWVGAEGVENVVAWLGAELAEGMATETFFFATGDISNLAGAAARTGRFGHPNAKTTARNGRMRAVMMPSPDPDPERLSDGFPLAAHVRELILLADGDSEPVWTATHMARAEARAALLAPGITATTIWPPSGMDWADVMAGVAA